MYKDLLEQIIKYLRPDEEYYPLLKVFRYIADITEYHFYLIHKKNDKIAMQMWLACVSIDYDEDNIELMVDKFYSDNSEIYLVSLKVNNFRHKFEIYPKILFVMDKTRLRVINYQNILDICCFNQNIVKGFSYDGTDGDSDNFKKYVLNLVKKIESRDIEDFPVSNFYEFEEKDIKRIRNGLDVFNDIRDISSRKEEDIPEKAKKYIQIC